MMMANIINHGNVTIMVKDIDKSITFYTKTLGLALAEVYGKEWAEVKTTGLTIGLHPHRKPKEKNQGISVGFTVRKLEPAMKALKKKGIKFSAIHHEGPVSLAFFTDPDSTPLYLCQMNY